MSASFKLCFFLPPVIGRMGEGNSFSLFTSWGGGVPNPALDEGGVPGPGPGGSLVSDFWGFPGLRFSGGGVPSLRFSGGGGGTQSQ